MPRSMNSTELVLAGARTSFFSDGTLESQIPENQIDCRQLLRQGWTC